MNLKDVQRVLKAKILVGEELMERPVETCCGSDLMSDVLAFTKCNTLLCTGLTNMQVIRTAGITDLCGIIIVRGNCPGRIFWTLRARRRCRCFQQTALCLKPAGCYMWPGCADVRRKTGAAGYDGG